MVARVGIYLFLLGIFFLFLFFAGAESGTLRIRWFLIGVIFTAGGITLWWKNRETSDVKRFRWFRRAILKEDQNEGE